MVRESLIDPWCAYLLSFVPRQSYPICWLSAWSKGRWSEVIAIKARDVIHANPIKLKAAKGSADRSIGSRPRGNEALWANCDTGTLLVVTGYDAVRHAIKAAITSSKLVLPEGHQDETHVWRHLWCSHMASLGHSRADIAKRMGHKRSSSTAHYIHDLGDITRNVTLSEG